MSLQHVAAKDRLRQQQESDQALKAAKLEAVDCLLWQTDFLQQQGSTQSPSGAPPHHQSHHVPKEYARVFKWHVPEAFP